MNRKSVKGNTALHDCAESGSLEIMKLLIGSGARYGNFMDVLVTNFFCKWVEELQKVVGPRGKELATVFAILSQAFRLGRRGP